MSIKKSAKNMRALRERKKQQGLKTLTRYVKPEWIPIIDLLIKQLKGE